MRLIDADRLQDIMKNVEQHFRETGFADGSIPLEVCNMVVEAVLNKSPTVDAVPVVRCKDCECSTCIGSLWNVHCVQYDIDVPNDGFCYKAERK